MFNLSKKLLTRPINYAINKYLFSNDLANAQQLMHQAIIAQRIISMIAQPNLFSDTIKLENSNSNLLQGNYPSLRQNVINYVNNYKAIEAQNNHVIKKAKNQILAYFQDGVVVDKDFCRPQKFVELQNMAKKKVKEKKLHFCPTYLVTGNLFRKIMYEDSNIFDQRYLLIKGQNGIGKSFSTLLYKMLSDHIYKWWAYYNQNKSTINVTDTENLQKFIGPKLIYCIITPLEDDVRSMEKKILKQCFQFGQDTVQKWKGKFLYQKEGYIINGINLGQKYRQLFKRSRVCMYDQINQQSKYLRVQDQIAKLQSNKMFSQQQINNIIKSKIKYSQKRLTKIFKRNQEIIQIRSQLYKSFNQTLYLSSNCIQQKYQGYLNLIPDIDDETVKKTDIQFPPSISEPSIISDTIQFIILAYQKTQRLQNHLLQSKNINLQRDKIQYSQVLNQFRNQLHNQFIENRYFITPFHIKLFTQTFKQNNIESQKFYSVDFLQNLSNHSKNIFTKNVKNFMKKDRNKQMELLKFNILIKMFTKSIQKQEQDQNQNQINQFPKIVIKNVNDSKIQYLQSTINKNLFKIYQIDGTKLTIKSVIPSLVIKQIFFQIQQEIYKYIFANLSFMREIIQKQDKGMILQQLFKRLLNNKENKIQCSVQGFKKTQQY